MGRSWIGSVRGEQLAMVPLDFRDALPEDHAAWYFKSVADELDMSEFEAKYRADGVGRPPYSPKAMLAVITYCASKKTISSRALAAACRDDIGARAIMGNVFPNRTAFNRFKKSHAKAIAGLLAQTLRLGQAEGLVDITVIAGDGTKIAANAAMSAAADGPGLQAQIDALTARLEIAVREWTALVLADGSGIPGVLFGEPDTMPAGQRGKHRGAGDPVTAWREVSTLRSVLGSREAAMTYLQEHPGAAHNDWTDRLERDQARVTACRERLEATRTDLTAAAAHREAITAPGKEPRGHPVPVEKHIRVRRAVQALATATARAEATAKDRPRLEKVNTTDPRSRIMPSKHGGYDQNYNIQGMTCRNQFILAFTVHDSANDKQALAPLLDATRKNLDDAGITATIGTALFDSGYASERNIATTTTTTTTTTGADTAIVDLLLISVERECRQTGRLTDGNSTAALAWKTMGDRLAEPANRELYKRRGAIIEPLFAQLFTCFGRNLTLRNENIETEIFLWAATHNLLKIKRARQKT
jgi:transposase